MSTDRDALVAEYDGRFTSGNAIPVDRIWLTAAMWQELRATLAAATAASDPLVAHEIEATGVVAHETAIGDSQADPASDSGMAALKATRMRTFAYQVLMTGLMSSDPETTREFRELSNRLLAQADGATA